MKFTKVTSTLVAGATLLAGLAVVAPVTTHAATVEGNASVNGGQALPQNGETTAGISFGQVPPTGNTGYLRLQMVPKILDFGNHEQFYAKYPVFTADGQNSGRTDNTINPNYKGGDTNQTAILNTDDAALANVKGKVWTTVVDKQTTRTATESAEDATGQTDEKAGDWTLSVKADGPLQLKVDSGNAIPGKTIDNATLSLQNGAYGQTGEVYNLTKESQDDGFTPVATLKPVADISKNTTMTLSAADTQHQVAQAATDEGEGANVFGWDKTNIKLVIPSSAVVNGGTYEATLTWSLATGLN